MALSLKVDTEDVPSIFQILGLGSGPPPIDATLRGQADDSGDTVPSQASSQQKSVPTKLGRLQQVIAASQGASDSPVMTDEHSSPSVPAPDVVPGSAPTPSLYDILRGPSPADANLAAAAQGMPPGAISDAPAVQSRVPSQMPDMGQGSAPAVAEHKSFAEQHPVLAKILQLGIGGAQGAAAGAGSTTFGEGYQRASELPLDIAGKKLGLEHTQAVIDQMKKMVRINGVDYPYDLAKRLYPTLVAEEGKNARNAANIDSRESIANDKNALALRKQGLKIDPTTGKQVPIPYNELSQREQATLDLTQSQQDAAQARADLDRSKNDPNSPAYKAAFGRLQVAQRNAATAAGRLGLAKDTFNANYLGTGPDGQALPGAPTDESGKPIGPRVANAGKPSADRLKRGDLAANAIHNLNNVEEIVTRRGDDLFGPIMGRITNVRDMIGSDDPDIAAVGTEIHNYALASNGAHGVRSQQAVEKTEDEILKQFKRGTNGAMGGIRAAKDSLLDFVKDQQLGNRARPQNPAPPKAQATPDNAQYEVYAADGKTLIGHTVNGKYVPLVK